MCLSTTTFVGALIRMEVIRNHWLCLLLFHLRWGGQNSEIPTPNSLPPWWSHPAQPLVVELGEFSDVMWHSMEMTQTGLTQSHEPFKTEPSGWSQTQVRFKAWEEEDVLLLPWRCSEPCGEKVGGPMDPRAQGKRARKLGPQVLQPQGTKSCQQQAWAWELELQEKTQPSQYLDFMACGFVSRESRHAVPAF